MDSWTLILEKRKGFTIEKKKKAFFSINYVKYLVIIGLVKKFI